MKIFLGILVDTFVIRRLAVAVFLIFMKLLSHSLYLCLLIIRVGTYFGFPVLSMSGHIYKYFCMIGIDVSDINIDG